MSKRRMPMCLALLLVWLLIGCTRGVTVATPAAATATSVPVTATAAIVAAATAAPTATATQTVVPTATTTPVATLRATPNTTLVTPARAASPTTVATGTVPAARPGPPVYPTQPRGLGQPAVQTAHYQFYDPEGTHAAVIALYAAEAEEIYAYVADRTGLQAPGALTIVLQTQAASDCAARGITYRDGMRISIFMAPTTPPGQLRMVLAHETTHALHLPYTAPDLDITLVEGFANWASLRYWSEWQGLANFDDAVRTYLADGRFVPVNDPPADCTIAGRDVIYNERASFVGFLIDRYGIDRFLAASKTSVLTGRASIPAIADYEQVYGETLTALLDEWVASLASN